MVSFLEGCRKFHNVGRLLRSGDPTLEERAMIWQNAQFSGKQNVRFVLLFWSSGEKAITFENCHTFAAILGSLNRAFSAPMVFLNYWIPRLFYALLGSLNKKNSDCFRTFQTFSGLISRWFSFQKIDFKSEIIKYSGTKKEFRGFAAKFEKSLSDSSGLDKIPCLLQVLQDFLKTCQIRGTLRHSLAKRNRENIT